MQWKAFMFGERSKLEWLSHSIQCSKYVIYHYSDVHISPFKKFKMLKKNSSSVWFCFNIFSFSFFSCSVSCRALEVSAIQLTPNRVIRYSGTSGLEELQVVKFERKVTESFKTKRERNSKKIMKCSSLLMTWWLVALSPPAHSPRRWSCCRPPAWWWSSPCCPGRPRPSTASLMLPKRNLMTQKIVSSNWWQRRLLAWKFQRFDFIIFSYHKNFGKNIWRWNSLRI